MFAIGFDVAAIALYLTAALLVGRRMVRATLDSAQRPYAAIGLAAVALLAHGAGVFQGMATPAGLDFGVFNAASMVTWVIVALVVLTALRQPVGNLLVSVLPLAAIAILADLLVPGRHLVLGRESIGLQLHILSSVIAFSLFAVAALQAMTLAVAEHQLRAKRPGAILRRLPPLQTMESLLFQMIAVGFLLLTLSLGSGFTFIDDLMAQHLAHKTILSITAWLVFAVLLWGRFHYGWRGRTALRWTLAGFALLVLAYFGVKIVLELILKRV